MKAPSYLALILMGLVACGGSEKTASEPSQPADDDDERLELGDRPTDRRSAVPDADDDDDEDPNLAVKGLKGRLDSYDIQQGVNRHAAAVANCYNRPAKKQKYLGGKVSFKFVVTREGDVKTVKIDESDLGSWEVESCLLEVARSMTFARPKGGEAEFQVPLEFTGRRRVLWWEEDKTQAEVAEKLVELEACQPVPSDVWVTLYIGTRGKVLSAGFASKHKQPIADEWATCAAQAIAAWELSDPRGQIAKGFFRFNP
jgi:TonB family protein